MTSTLIALAAATLSSATIAAGVDAELRGELERIAQRRIFFGHQSVGANLLDGVRQLATMADVPIRVVESPTAGGVTQATLGHAFVAENGNPLQKLKSFEQAMGQQPTGIDIALVKFCYVDITANTDAKALFARYSATIDALRAKNPGTTFVHVTAPLTSVRGDAKDYLKRLLGRGDPAMNMRREEYNALLRKAYQGREPVFDLARIESTAPDGKAVTVEWMGNISPAMSTAYTDDGGHLNATGKILAARELISVLAAIPVRPVSGKSAR
jgi:hypothetical protein